MRLAAVLPALFLAGVTSHAALARTAPTTPVPPATRATPAQMRPLSADDLVRLRRLTDPKVSPDGHYVAFVLRETDMDANRGRTDIWLLDLTQKSAAPRRLTTSPANDTSPRWAPDSRTVYFLSGRSGHSQVWRLSLAGGEAARVTDYPLDIGSMTVAPHGDQIAVSMEVFPDCVDLPCTKDRLEVPAKDKATVRIYDRMFVRHWDTWSNGTRSHLFTAC